MRSDKCQHGQSAVDARCCSLTQNGPPWEANEKFRWPLGPLHGLERTVPPRRDGRARRAGNCWLLGARGLGDLGRMPSISLCWILEMVFAGCDLCSCLFVWFARGWLLRLTKPNCQLHDCARFKGLAPSLVPTYTVLADPHASVLASLGDPGTGVFVRTHTPSGLAHEPDLPLATALLTRPCAARWGDEPATKLGTRSFRLARDIAPPGATSAFPTHHIC